MVETHAVGERVGEQRGTLVGEEVDVRVDAVLAVLAEREDAQRHPWVRGGDGDVNRRAVADPLTARLRRVSVEDRREEDRAARRVEVEDFGRGRGETEAVVSGPAPDFGAAALEDGDVERVDAHLEDDLSIGRKGRPHGAEEDRLLGRRGLTDQALQGPVPALFDGARDAGERDEGAELAGAAGELERGDVVLDTVVITRERGGAEQVDRAVGADETRAGCGRLCRTDERRDHRGKDREEPSHTSLLSGQGREC